MSVKTNDPQTTVTAYLKEGKCGELLTFAVFLGQFELVAIVNIPEEGQTTSPVYIKYKVRHQNQKTKEQGDARTDRDDNHED